MKIFKSTGRFIFKTFLDVPSWISFNSTKQSTVKLTEYIRHVFTPKLSEEKTTFEEAVARFGLSEEDIAKRLRSFHRQAVLFLLCGCICIAYVFYLFFTRHFLAGVIGFLAAGLFFIKAFALHFWYFQVQNRKLGCTFKEWFNGKIEEGSAQ